MIDNEQGHLSAELLLLQTQHRQMDEQIIELHEGLYIDQLQLQRFKREKLRLKELISKVKCRLIPDLDA
ncbi:MAG: hypothetical protein ACJA0N_001311 [Pseudohongiellaceae bacterium]|jgi:hypothetical protein